jgi:hypothetical protein
VWIAGLLEVITKFVAIFLSVFGFLKNLITAGFYLSLSLSCCSDGGFEPAM